MHFFARRRAFTLLEILIAMAIVVALAALLLPAILHSQASARAATCVSNLKQLHNAFALYAQDNDGLLPPYQNTKHAGWGSDTTGTIPVPDQADLLVHALTPYTKTRDIWFCPEDIYQRHATAEEQIDHRFTSFRVNPKLGSAKISGNVVHLDGYHVTAREVSPSDLALLTDCLTNCGPMPPPPDGLPRVEQAYSHNGKFNVMYFDGHAKALSRSQVQVP